MSHGKSLVSHDHSTRKQITDRSRPQLDNSLLMGELREKLLLDVMRKNSRKWGNEVMGMETTRGLSENKWEGGWSIGGEAWEGRTWQRVSERMLPETEWSHVSVWCIKACCKIWLSMSYSEDDEMFWKCSSTPAELIHSLWFTGATPCRINASLFPLWSYALPSWYNHTNQSFLLESTAFIHCWNRLDAGKGKFHFQLLERSLHWQHEQLRWGMFDVFMMELLKELLFWLSVWSKFCIRWVEEQNRYRWVCEGGSVSPHSHSE